ncbi:MAG: hypothetical protein V3T83_04175 [Acidobacteriota bacterium]
MKKICCAVLCVVLVLPAFALPPTDNSIEGTWEGVASGPQDPEIPFSVVFKLEENVWKGTMDVPSEGMTGLPLQDVSFDGKKLAFVIPLPEAAVTCSAEVQPDGTISGTFEQAGQNGTFKMKKQK